MSVTLTISNLFNDPEVTSNATEYFGEHYSDDEVWLYFLNTGGNISYTDENSGNTTTVQDAVAIQLSTVKNNEFSLVADEESTKLFAGLGATNPFSGPDGPGIFDQDVPYALAEWTINDNSFDNVDVSYIDSFSYPTTLNVKNPSGNNFQASFSAGTKASDVIKSFSSQMSDKPNGPNNSNYPQKGQVGYGPAVNTVAGNAMAERWIGSSKFYISGPDSNQLRSMYLYAPSFHDFLNFLQQNEPTTQTNSGAIKGWYIDYSGNGGYSGYLSISGDTNSGFGLQIHDVRVNTNPSAANSWAADPNAGTAVTGTVTVAANNSQLPFDPADGSQVLGLWTDAVIYSGAALMGSIGGGPVVTATGDLAPGGANSEIVATFLASISASVATGLLGSQQYLKAYKSSTPKSTMYWFNTMTRADSTQKLFSQAWPKGEEYYDPFWAVLANATDNQGYLSPFNDRWANFSPGFALESGAKILWELGIPS